ncbi:sigma C [Reptilian orthoreovirus]|uniref:Sigma C n=1 Tax=Reptilian orthoreovirus TaxID=226613 RepID=W8PTM7_9REOV|nr:sigma C [Reptilian orthoreovirus]AHL26970.1 sigma C [Reptilian orthoreovirus]
MSNLFTDAQRSAIIRICLAMSDGGAGTGNIDEVEKQVKELSVEVASIQTEITDLATNLGRLDQKVNSLGGDVLGLSNDITILKGHVEEIITQVRRQVEQITALETSVSQNIRDIDTVRNTVADLGTLVVSEKTRLDNVTRDVSTQALSITDLQQRVSKLERESEPTSYEWPLKKDATTGLLKLIWDPWFLETTPIMGLSWAQTGVDIGPTTGQGAWHKQDGTYLFTVQLNFVFSRYRSMGAFSLATGNALLSGSKVELRIPYTTSGTGMSGTEFENMTPTSTSKFPLTFVTRITVGASELTMPITLTIKRIDTVDHIVLTPADLPSLENYPCYLKGESTFYYMRYRQLT